MITRKNWITAALFFLLSAAVFTGTVTAASDFVIALPNGYDMVHGKKGEPTIVKRKGRVVVPGPIARYVVLHDVVTGQVQAATTAPAGAPAKPAGDTAADSKQGYFVLNTQTGEVAMNLSEADWNARLKALSLPESPGLSPPLLPK